MACAGCSDWEDTQFGEAGQGINFPSLTPRVVGRLPAQPMNKTAKLKTNHFPIISISLLCFFERSRQDGICSSIFLNHSLDLFEVFFESYRFAFFIDCIGSGTTVYPCRL